MNPSEMTKILLIYGRISRSDASEKDGGADYLFNLAKTMAAKGIDVHVLVAEGSSGTDEGVSIHHVGFNWLLSENRFRIYRAVDRFLAELQPDHVVLIHPDGRRPSVNIGFLYAILFGRGYYFHIILFFLGIRGRSLASVALFLGLCARATSLIFSDPDTRQRIPLLKKLKGRSCILPVGSNLMVGPNEDLGIAEAQVHNLLIEAGTRYVAYFGYIGEEKGTDLLVDAFAKVSKQYPECRLLIICGLAGDAYENKIRVRIERLGITERVIWTGYRSPSESIAILQKAQFVVLPYRATIVGRSSLAAALLANGVVLTSRPISNWSKFIHGENIYLTLPGNANELENAMLALLSDPTLIQKLKRGSSSLAREFEWSTIATELLKIVDGRGSVG